MCCRRSPTYSSRNLALVRVAVRLACLTLVVGNASLGQEQQPGGRSQHGVYRRDPSSSSSRNWNHRGRGSIGSAGTPAALRARAYRQKMAMRAARTAHLQIGALRGSHSISKSPTAPTTIVWAPMGPSPLASDATGDGMQDYNWVSGRATSVVIDPADGTGNTVLVGGAYGGLWKSTNAGSQSLSPAAVVWQPLIDDQPTLAVGAIAIQPGNSNLILVGTGETNSSGDSYYGLGILRSADGGQTWTQITGVGQSPDSTFLGVGFSKIAFSTAIPNLVVAATAADSGLYVGLEQDANSTARGLFFSADGGATWNHATLSDGAVPSSATSVIYNPGQGANGTFYAFIRRHGLYYSTDGQHFTPLAAQPIAGMSSANCPTNSNATACPIYRGETAVVPGRNEMYAWMVDVQPDPQPSGSANPVATDEGIWQTMDGGVTWTQIPDNGIPNCGDSAFGPNSGCGVEDGWYTLELAAIPNNAGTDIYAGAVNLYKCTLTGGTTCSQGDWINLTHAYGCNPGPLGAPAHVHPNQHALAFATVNSTAPGYFAHDGGISRTLDGYSGLNSGSCTGTNQFDSLSQTLSSMTEFVSFSADPTNPDVMLGGTQGNGSPKTSIATSSGTWFNALGGDGALTAINPATPTEWFAANPYVDILKCESGIDCDDSGFVQVVGSNDLGGDQGAYNTPYILDPQNTTELLVGTCRVWRISTSGSAPQQLSNDFDTLGRGVCTGNETNLVDALAAGGPTDANGNSKVVYAVTNGIGPQAGPVTGIPGGAVWATTNAGVTPMTNVTQNVNPNGYAISTVAMDSSDATGNTAYLGIMGFSTRTFPTRHVWKTTNAGSGWADWSGSGATALPDAPVNALVVDTQEALIYAGTDVGVFVSSTTAASWTEVGPMPGPGISGFLPNAPVTALQLFIPDANTKTLLASTYGRGIWNYALVTAPGYRNVILFSPQTIFPTQTAVFSGTLTAQGGYASAVNLSCGGAAPAVCTVSPSSATPTATYSVTAGGSPGDYIFGAHAVGTDDNAITHDAPITLHVVDFDLTAPAPNSVFVAQNGTSATSTFQVTAAASFAEAVTLSCSGLPVGAACIFSPAGPFNPTSSAPVTVHLTVTATASATLGGPTMVTISAMAAGAPAAKTNTFELTVTVPAEFTWTDTGNSTVTVLAGQSATFTFSAAPLGNPTFLAPLTFVCAGLPALTTCTFNPASIAAGAAATAVTLSVATAGPNTGRRSQSKASTWGQTLSVQAAPSRAPDYRILSFALAASMAGMVFVGRRKRRRRLGSVHICIGISLICIALGLMPLVSCGGVTGQTITAPPPTVTVQPALANLFAAEAGNAWPPKLTQQQFTAKVTNSNSQAVTWSVVGGTPNGTIDGTGLYSAPPVVPNPGAVTINATSTAASSPGTASINLVAPTPLGAWQIDVTAAATGGPSHNDVVILVVQ
jgi:hypothetical protein